MAVACVVVIEMGNPILGLIPAVGQCGMGTVKDNYELGAEKDAESPFQLLIHIFQNLGNSHALTTSISVCSIIFLFSIRYLKFKYSHIQKLQLIPEILVLVVVSTILSFTLRWDCHGVVILNKIEQKIPDGVGLYPVPTVPKIKHLFLPAILISVIGFVESIAVAKKYAAKHRYNVSPNRELVALGAGNSIIAFFGGFPAFGSLGRSAVNDSTGARTQMAGFVAGFVVLATYLWLLPFFEYLPKAVCSAIIVVAAVKLMEFEDIVFMFHLRAWNDLALMLITFCSTIFISIEIGTLLSVGISLLLVVRHTTTVCYFI
jgi:MFS superfamily sulfate permease-like transporter